MTCCLLLAAGASRRFGSEKMAHALPGGRALLSTTIELYSRVFDQVNVVVRENDLLIKNLAEESGAFCIKSLRAELGMSQSIIAGVQANASADRWLIALGDMPYISHQTIDLLLSTEGDIVAPRHCGQIGNPVIFSHRFKADLLALKGDRGGRSILRDHPQALSLVEVQDSGVLYDIDTPESIR